MAGTYNKKKETWCFLDHNPHLRGVFCYNTHMNDSIQCEEFYDDRKEQWIIELNQASDSGANTQ